jgi:paraquat-inducible protein B
MKPGPNPFKLGLFILGAIAATAGTAVAVGERAVNRDSVVYHTYFNESVQGLDIGAPVKYRGVTIGTVSDIQIAPDRRHVDVHEKLTVREIRRLGLVEGGGGEEHFVVPSDLRAQLGTQGITGVKFILIDFFDPKNNPAPELPFKPKRHYIPAAASLLKNIEDSAQKTLDKLPDVADKLASSLSRIDQMLQEINQRHIPDRLVATLDEATAMLRDIRAFLASLSAEELPARASKMLASIDAASAKLGEVLERLSGDRGLLASVRRTSDATLDLAKTANGRAQDLESTLRDLGEAAQAIRDLSEELEKHPDMLVKGRAERGGE